MPTVATIGVYGFTADGFLRMLEEERVRVLLDVRQRRGVRGSEYAWANAQRLQAALAVAGVEYRHHKELAPTTELPAAAVRGGRAQRRGQALPGAAGAGIRGS